MLTWPHEQSDWAPILDRVEPVFVEITRQVARFEKVLVACYDDRHRAQVAKRLTAAGVAANRVVLGIAPPTTPGRATMARSRSSARMN